MSTMPATGLLHLPRELLLDIASKLRTSELNQFIRTNRAIHELLFAELCKRNRKDFRFLGSALFDYCHHNYEIGIRTMLEVGANANSRCMCAPFDTILTCVARWGKLAAARILLEHGANPNVCNPFSSTPLGFASRRSQGAPMVELLFEYKVDINRGGRRGRAPLIEAIYAFSAPEISYYLTMGADVNVREPEGGTALHIVSEKYVPMEIFKIILDAGPQVDCFDKENLSPLHIAAFYLLEDRVSVLLRHGAQINLQSPNGPDKGWTALHYAASTPEKYASKIITSLIQQGSSVEEKDAIGRTPFLVTRAESDPACMYSRVEAFLQQGADIKAQDYRGWSALHYQADAMSVRLVKWLCDRGCDINCKNHNNDTPLFQAIGSRNYRKQHPAMVQEMLYLGAHVNLENSQGCTPLSLAVERGHPEIIRLLLEHGADVHHRNERGSTALHQAFTICEVKHWQDYPVRPPHCATREEIYEMIQLLVEYGGDVNMEDFSGTTPLMLNRYPDILGASPSVYK